MVRQISPLQAEGLREAVRFNIDNNINDPELTGHINKLIELKMVDPRDLQITNLTRGEATVEGLKNTARGVTNTVGGLLQVPEMLDSPVEGFNPIFGPELPQALSSAGEQVRQFGEEQFRTTPTSQLDPVSGMLQSGNRVLGESIPFILSFQGGGGLIVRGLTKEQTASLGTFSRLLAESARNPGKFTTLESIESAISGGAGESVAREFGEDGRLTTEFMAAFGPTLTVRLLRGIKDGIQTFAPLSEESARRIVGDTLAEILDENPSFRVNLAETEKAMEEVPGLKSTFGAATQSPKLSAVESSLGIDKSSITANNRKAFNNYSNRIRSVLSTPEIDPETGRVLSPDANIPTSGFQDSSNRIPSVQRNVGNALQEEIQTITNDALQDISVRSDRLIKNFSDDISGIADKQTREVAGKNLQESIIELESLARNEVSFLYKQIPDTVLPPDILKPLRRSLASARLRKAKGKNLQPELESVINQFRGSFAFRGKKISVEKNVFDSTTLTIKDVVKETPINFNKNTIGALNELDGLVTSEMRAAGKAGDTDLVRRLQIIKEGIESTYDKALESGKFLPGEEAVFREGKRLRTEFGRLFQDFEMQSLLAKTGQGQLKIAPEDLMNTFLKRGEQKRVFESAKVFQEVFKNTPEAKGLIRNELYRRMVNFAGNAENELLDPVKVRTFIQKNKDAIKAYNLTDDFANVRTASKNASEQADKFKASEDQIQKSAFKEFADSEDLEGFFSGLLKNPKKFEKFNREALNSGNRIKAGYRGAVVEHLINSTIKREIAETGVETPIFNGKFLEKVLINSKDHLKKVLGPTHFNMLENFALNLKRIPVQNVPGADLITAAQEISQPSVKKLANTVRQVNQRILSPATVAITLPIESLQAAKSKIIRKALTDALTDFDKARELIKASQNRRTAPVVRSLFSSGIGLFFGNLESNPQQSQAERAEALKRTQEEIALAGTEGPRKQKRRNTFKTILEFKKAMGVSP